MTFGTTRVVVRQLYAPAAFTTGEIRGTHFQGLSRPQGTWLCRREPRKKSPVPPPGIDRGTIRLVAQCLNHYATPGPIAIWLWEFICCLHCGFLNHNETTMSLKCPGGYRLLQNQHLASIYMLSDAHSFHFKYITCNTEGFFIKKKLCRQWRATLSARRSNQRKIP